MYLQAAKQLGGRAVFRVVRKLGDTREKLFLYDVKEAGAADNFIAGGMLVTQRSEQS